MLHLEGLLFNMNEDLQLVTACWGLANCLVI